MCARMGSIFNSHDAEKDDHHLDHGGTLNTGRGRFVVLKFNSARATSKEARGHGRRVQCYFRFSLRKEEPFWTCEKVETISVCSPKK